MESGGLMSAPKSEGGRWACADPPQLPADAAPAGQPEAAPARPPGARRKSRQGRERPLWRSRGTVGFGFEIVDARDTPDDRGLTAVAGPNPVTLLIWPSTSAPHSFRSIARSRDAIDSIRGLGGDAGLPSAGVDEEGEAPAFVRPIDPHLASDL
jgi:hypothetical protein